MKEYECECGFKSDSLLRYIIHYLFLECYDENLELKEEDDEK